MKTSFKPVVFVLLILLGINPLFAETEAETRLGNKLLMALESYNKVSGTRDFNRVAFWTDKKMITTSLARALKSAKAFDADPFLDAQDTVPGILIKNVKIEEALAKVTVGIKPSSPADKPVTLTYILFLEGADWKIDDINYGKTTLKQRLLSTSNALGI